VPGIAEGVSHNAYRQFTPAIRELAAYVARLHRAETRRVLEVLNRDVPAQKYDRVASLVLSAGGLWRRIPVDEQLDCGDRVGQAAKDVFWRNSDWAKVDANGKLGTPDPAGRAKVMGMQAVAAVERVRLEIEERYGMTRSAVAWQVEAARFEFGMAYDAHFAGRYNAPDARAAARSWFMSASRTRAVWDREFDDGGDLQVVADAESSAHRSAQLDAFLRRARSRRRPRNQQRLDPGSPTNRRTP
jgi:hypothetical protein